MFGLFKIRLLRYSELTLKARKSVRLCLVFLKHAYFEMFIAAEVTDLILKI